MSFDSIPLVAAISLLLYLHRRTVRKQRQEDAMDPHKSLDFGFGEIPGATGKSARKSFFGGEKGSRKHQGLSMDMNLSTPYLLPPGMQQSRESLHSLTRTIHQSEDPYRIQLYPGSDTASMRSFQRGHDGGSIYTKESGGLNSGAHLCSAPPSPQPGSRQNSLPMSPPPALKSGTSRHAAPVITEPQSAELVLPSPAPTQESFILPHPDPVVHHRESLPYPVEDRGNHAGHASIPSIQEPPPVAQRNSRSGLVGSIPSPHESLVSTPLDTIPEPYAVGHAMTNDDAPRYSLDPDFVPEAEAAPIGLGVLYRPTDPHVTHTSPPPVHATPASPEAHQAIPHIGPVIEEPEGLYEDYYDPRHESQDQFEYEDRGRIAHRVSSHYFNDDSHPGLGVPEHEAKRLSVGLRPLPPDEYIETEDPETRANRIRSFYKEYFDDSRPEPMPQIPEQYAQQDYYEDYDQGYLGKGVAYFDPENNAFVMPYAQPVSRRAMTPPPSGSRFPGPRPPRALHGSIGGMSMPGGIRGPPRPGSSVSNQAGPRAASSMSGRGGPRRPPPPPAALTTLPTPSKLKDDSFALLGAIDFAPPDTFRDQAAGRAQSPFGERRPYQMKLPAASPLLSVYDEMAALPSPYVYSYFMAKF